MKNRSLPYNQSLKNTWSAHDNSRFRFSSSGVSLKICLISPKFLCWKKNILFKHLRLDQDRKRIVDEKKMQSLIPKTDYQIIFAIISIIGTHTFLCWDAIYASGNGNGLSFVVPADSPPNQFGICASRTKRVHDGKWCMSNKRMHGTKYYRLNQIGICALRIKRVMIVDAKYSTQEHVIKYHKVKSHPTPPTVPYQNQPKHSKRGGGRKHASSL